MVAHCIQYCTLYLMYCSCYRQRTKCRQRSEITGASANIGIVFSSDRIRMTALTMVITGRSKFLPLLQANTQGACAIMTPSHE